MATSSDGVQVHVNLPQQQKGAKAPATLDHLEINPEAPQTDHNPAEESLSSFAMWALFAFGWVFLPCWWIGAAAGLRNGRDGEFLVKRRKKLNKQQTYAWWASVIMSIVSALVLILVLAIYFGRPAPAQEGPFYLTIAGPDGTLPDFNNPETLQGVRKAVRSALQLESAYPLSNINVWLSSKQEVTTGHVPVRRLAEASTVYVAVLGCTLLRTEQLPAAKELTDLIKTPALQTRISLPRLAW